MPETDLADKYNTADRLAFLGVVIAVIFGIWGVWLSTKTLNTSVDISHFDTLLSKTDSTISGQSVIIKEQQQLVVNSNSETDSLVSINKSLYKQIGILSNQYSLNLDAQKTANEVTENDNKSNEAKFYIASQKLRLIEWQVHKYPSTFHERDSLQRATYLNDINSVLESQLDNPYLISNKYMLQNWIDVRDSISNYSFNSNFYPIVPAGSDEFSKDSSKLLNQYINCFIAIDRLQSAVTYYMAYYEWRNDPSFIAKKIKKPLPKQYKETMDFLRIHGNKMETDCL